MHDRLKLVTSPVRMPRSRHKAPTSEEIRNCKPGDFLEWDYRISREEPTASTSATTPAESCIPSDVSLRVAQWNIERGYQLPIIIDTLRRMKADVITLQELDIGCERSQFSNVAEEIAKALSAQLVFAVEFEEFDCPTRSFENRCGQQGPRACKALHGNAILSKRHSLLCPTVVEHSWKLDWNTKGVLFNEPRRGFRNYLRCEIEIGELPSSVGSGHPMHLLAVYTLHLEVFHCGPLGRARQLGDVMHDATKLLEQTKAPCTFHAFIGGDLNTIGHSIVRCSGKYCAEKSMRLATLGENESTWLQRKVLCRNIPQESSVLQRFVTNSDWLWRILYGFSPTELRRLRNTSLCLWDPFDKYSDVTMNNPAYYGLVQGKLDWALFSNVIVRSKTMENEDYKASDHKLLIVDLVLPYGTTAKETYVPWKQNILGELLPYVIVRFTALVMVWHLISRSLTFITSP